MNDLLIHEIFAQHNIGPVNLIEKIDIGWTNTVFSINNRFILKICSDLDNEERFETEIFFYEFFKGKIPIPEVLMYDKSKTICEYQYLIYPKIQGANLYTQWHLLEKEERKNIIKEICAILTIINESKLDEFTSHFKLQTTFSWRKKIVDKIENSLNVIEARNILHKDSVQAIRAYVNTNQHVLNEQDIRIVYWDIHFNNLLIKNKKISGILDFERTELCSIDFVLDVIHRMVHRPTKYVSAQHEHYIRAEDYANLMDGFKEYYPELFKFKHLPQRINLYSIEHDLETLIYWPEHQKLKEIVLDLVRQN